MRRHLWGESNQRRTFLSFMRDLWENSCQRRGKHNNRKEMANLVLLHSFVISRISPQPDQWPPTIASINIFAIRKYSTSRINIFAILRYSTSRMRFLSSYWILTCFESLMIIVDQHWPPFCPSVLEPGLYLGVRHLQVLSHLGPGVNNYHLMFLWE